MHLRMRIAIISCCPIYLLVYLFFSFPVHSAQAVRIISFTMSDLCFSLREADSKLKKEQKSLDPFDDHLYTYGNRISVMHNSSWQLEDIDTVL